MGVSIKSGSCERSRLAPCVGVASVAARARGELADRLGRYVNLMVNNHAKDETIPYIARTQGVRLA